MHGIGRVSRGVVLGCGVMALLGAGAAWGEGETARGGVPVPRPRMDGMPEGRRGLSAPHESMRHEQQPEWLQDRPQRRDRMEHRHDRREDLRDRREDVRDRREDWKDRRDDVRDRRADRRDHREDRREQHQKHQEHQERLDHGVRDHGQGQGRGGVGQGGEHRSPHAEGLRPRGGRRP